MYIQNQIKRTISTPASREIIRELLQDKEIKNRTKLAKRVCEEFNFYDTRGQAQISGCTKALRELEKAGHITLPATSKKTGYGTPRRLDSPVPIPVGVPGNAGDVQDLQLILVETKEELALWNELMLGEHPLGAGPLVGR